MLSRRLTAIMLLTLMLSPVMTLASGSQPVNPPKLDLKKEPQSESGPSCDEVLSKCDKALSSQRKLNLKLKETIKAQDELVLTQRDRIDQLERSSNSFLKSPWLWFGVGIITGVIITK